MISDTDVHTFLAGYQHVAVPDLSDSRVHDSSIIYVKPISLDLMHLQERPSNIAAVLLASYCNVLGLYCATSDIMVGILSASGVVPIRLRWDAGMVWGDLVDETHRSLDESVGTKFTESELRNHLGLKSDQSPFTALFGFDGLDPGLLHTVTTSDLSKVPVLLFNPSKACLSFWTSSHLIHPSVANQLLSQISILSVYAAQHSTSQITSHPPYPVDLLSTVKLLSTDARPPVYEHIRLVTIATDYILPYAKAYPDAPAVCWYPTLSAGPKDNFDPQTLSYGDLHTQANRFARYLISRELKPEDRVAVCMDRNCLFHVVLFGVLRAGGCYVPVCRKKPSFLRSLI